MKVKQCVILIFVTLVIFSCSHKEEKSKWTASDIRTYYKAAPENVQTRWSSAENPNAEKGQGGKTNKGAKGDAFRMIGPGDSSIIFDQKGAGIITKIWSACSFGWTHENRRKVVINMYWDESEKPAVSVPFTDFFGIGHGLMRPFENEFFAMPEGRSFNCFSPMPYQTAARIEIVNETDKFLMFYNKVDFVKLTELDDDVLYFHAFWNRDTATTKGVDYEILPKVEGRGRYMGTNIGVIGSEVYRGTWFGEGEVKIYLDGDSEYPTLVGTGTEDYIGTGWGQGEYVNRFQGSLVSDRQNDIYAFYRYHLIDPVYFHNDCRVTIQQIGNSVRNKIREMNENGADITPVWSYVEKDGYDAAKRYLDMENPPAVESDEFPDNVSTNFYRSDDVSATAYFYLDRPSNDLPPLPSLDVRLKNLKRKVYDKLAEKW